MNDLIINQCRLCQNDEQYQPIIISFLNKNITKEKCMEQCGVGKTSLNTHLAGHMRKEIFAKIAMSDPDFVRQVKDNIIEVMDIMDNYKDILTELDNEKKTSGYDPERIKLVISANKEMSNIVDKLVNILKALDTRDKVETKVQFNVNMEAQDFLFNDACPNCKQKASKRFNLKKVETVNET